MVLSRIAPHLVQPLAFLFPTYRGSAWPLWQLRIGVKVYDLLCGRRNLGPSRVARRRRALVKNCRSVNRHGSYRSGPLFRRPD